MADTGSGSGSRLILASASAARREMLARAGIVFDVSPAKVDERAIRATLEADGNLLEPDDVAEVLARAKAEAVSREHPDAIVIGSDQVLALDGEIYEKPPTGEAARQQLLALRGRRHELHAAVALAEGGETQWSATDVAVLAVRRFSMTFLEEYLARLGPEVCETVGAYKLEGLGAQLFEAIDGDYFTILGMPLLPLLEELRQRKVIRT